MKKFKACITAFVLLLLVFPAAAAENPITVYLDGEPVDFGETNGKPVNALIVYDYAYVPVARIIEILAGTTPDWDNATKTASFEFNGKNYAINTNEKGIYINGAFRNSVTGTAPVIINDRTLIPLKMLSDALGFTQQYDSKEHVVRLTSPVIKPELKPEVPATPEVTKPEKPEIPSVSKPSTPSTPAVPATPAAPAKPSIDTNALANTVISLVNSERADAGLPALSYNSGLASNAASRAIELSTGSSADSKIDGTKSWGVCTGLGHNSPERVVASWMRSANANILLGEKYRQIGVGVAANDVGQLFWVLLVSD